MKYKFPKAALSVPTVFTLVLSLLLCGWNFLSAAPDEPFNYFENSVITLAAMCALGVIAWLYLSNARRRKSLHVLVVLIGALGIAGIGSAWKCQSLVASIPQDQMRTAVSQAAQDATVAMEDRHFYEHGGLDWEALHRALRVNFRAGYTKQGGSTITQQLAKNLFLSNDRTVFRKLLELPLTLAIERSFSKAQILDLYMHSIPYGCGYHGIDEAAKGYFHTTADQLTLAQAAFLVGVVPHNPNVLPSDATLDSWRNEALERVASRFPERYDDSATYVAQVPIDHLIYPGRIAFERGATATIPRGWDGVLWFSYLSDSTPNEIKFVAPRLKTQLSQFVGEARKQNGLVAIDHLGVFADRTQRNNESKTSSHAYGRAIDIAGFRFADGTEARVKDHARPEVLSRLAPMITLLRKHFDLVVDWSNEPKWHQDHIHAEIKP